MFESVRLKFKYTEQEYRAAVRVYMLHTPRVLIRTSLSVALMTFAVFMMSLFADAGLLSGLLWAALLLTVIASNIFYLTPKRLFRGEPKFRDEYTLEFSDEGIHATTINADSKLNWRLYTKAVEHKNLYLLIYGTYMMTVVPKRAFISAEQEMEFRGLLSRNLGFKSSAKHLSAGKGELQSGYAPPPEPPDWR